MSEVCTHTHSITVHSNVDPTRTTSLRNAFVANSNRRFRELTAAIRKAVAVEDVFGLGQESPETIIIQQLSTPGPGAFAFPRSSDKVRSFMRWLQAQQEAGILQTITLPQLGAGVEAGWTNIYIQDSYKRGVMRARYEMKKAGFDVPTLDATGGIEVSMSTPFHIDRLGLLYTRAFSELKGITAAMDQQISRVLAQGLADGDGPRLLARKIVGTINGTGKDVLGLTDSLGRFIPAQRRAEIMARTEMIRAHHQATIQEYMNWGVEGVAVKAEFMTAGDNRVCSQCNALEGEIFPLEVAMNIIPVHPQCRCIALPYKELGR